MDIKSNFKERRTIVEIKCPKHIIKKWNKSRRCQWDWFKQPLKLGFKVKQRQLSRKKYEKNTSF